MDTEIEELRKRFEKADLEREPQVSSKPVSLRLAKLKKLLRAGAKIVSVAPRKKSSTVAADDGMSRREITREQAAGIAAHNLRWSEEYRWHQIRSVLELSEIRQTRPCLYNVSEEELEGAWIVYLHDPNFLGLRSSTIMVISRATGHVRYLGSACDEG
ncbi:MAG: hypothetical protein WB646_16470 [Steroidobacteraceae bacterium]